VSYRNLKKVEGARPYLATCSRISVLRSFPDNPDLEKKGEEKEKKEEEKRRRRGTVR